MVRKATPVSHFSVSLWVAPVYGAPMSNSTHVAWPKIESFSTVRKYARDRGVGTLTYKAKVKLHGSCAGIRINADGSVFAFSRERVLSLDADNYGFARWVDVHKPFFAAMAEADRTNADIVLYGEWCGPGIQSKVAIAKAPHKVFALFSVVALIPEGHEMVSDPGMFKTGLQRVATKTGLPIPNEIRVIPYDEDGNEYPIDFQLHDELLVDVVSSINKRVLEVEAEDPFVKEHWNISGIGEGLVFYPQGRTYKESYDLFVDYAFKAKGGEHQVIATKSPVMIDPVKAKSIGDFAEMVITPARLAQGAEHTNGEGGTFVKSNIPIFLKWIGADIEKECQNEMAVAELDPAAAVRACQARARMWYLAECDK